LTPDGRLEKPTYAAQHNASLVDHFVGADQEGLRDRQPERLGGGQIDDEVELARLLNRDIGRLCQFD
jgi:hypothetical protein